MSTLDAKSNLSKTDFLWVKLQEALFRGGAWLNGSPTPHCPEAASQADEILRVF